MDLGLQGKVAIVSGGSKGIGRAIATMLASEGARVMIAARSQGPLDEALEALRELAPGRVAAVAADMTDPAGVADVVQRRSLGVNLNDLMS